MKSFDFVFMFVSHYLTLAGWVWLLMNLGQGHLGMLESTLMCTQMAILSVLVRVYHIMVEDRDEP